MQMDSSAIPTCFRLLSAVECTATVLMPMVWQARSTRSAISPRLAIRTLSSMASADHEQRLIEFHRLAVFGHDGDHGAGYFGFDLVEHLHRFDHAERVTNLHLLPDLDERFGAGRSGGVEGADHGRAHDGAGGQAGFRGRG